MSQHTWEVELWFFFIFLFFLLEELSDMEFDLPYLVSNPINPGHVCEKGKYIMVLS